MHTARHQHSIALRDTRRHHGRFRCSGRTVIHRGVGNFHPGQLADHGLEFEDGLQRALRNFCLIGCIGGKELAARNQRVNDHRPVVQVRAGAQKRAQAVAILARAFAEPLYDFRLRHLPGNFQIALQAILFRDRREQIVNGSRTYNFQYGFAVGR